MSPSSTIQFRRYYQLFAKNLKKSRFPQRTAFGGGIFHMYAITRQDQSEYQMGSA